MEKQFRALGVASSFFKVLAWIVLIVGIVATIVVAAIGAIQARFEELGMEDWLCE